MATLNQMKANQANAQKSTGPKTEAGKATASRNRLSHGFASSAVIMPGENADEFKALLYSLVAEYQPAGETEQILVEKMAVNQWLSLRAFRLQGLAFRAQPLGDGNLPMPKDLNLLIRYHTSAERAFHKAHSELVKAQKERKKSEIGSEPQKAVEPASTAPDCPPSTTPATDDPSVDPRQPREIHPDGIDSFDEAA